MKKIELTFINGDVVVFDTVSELMDYIGENKLLSPGFTSEGLIKIWDHAEPKLAVESELFEKIIIHDVYSAEMCHRKLYTFHTFEPFEDFMVAVGATRGNVRTGARYGIYGGEIVTKKYDCIISAVAPKYREWD